MATYWTPSGDDDEDGEIAVVDEYQGESHPKAFMPPPPGSLPALPKTASVCRAASSWELEPSASGALPVGSVGALPPLPPTGIDITQKRAMIQARVDALKLLGIGGGPPYWLLQLDTCG